ncbi:hypothetical protein BVG81_006205 [Haliangium sp. UPWRP_2]|nr:hypothetical protein BVG81_006205 [Haliangium sp. UPWRP_2]
MIGHDLDQCGTAGQASLDIRKHRAGAIAREPCPQTTGITQQRLFLLLFFGLQLGQQLLIFLSAVDARAG